MSGLMMVLRCGIDLQSRALSNASRAPVTMLEHHDANRWCVGLALVVLDMILLIASVFAQNVMAFALAVVPTSTA